MFASRHGAFSFTFYPQIFRGRSTARRIRRGGRRKAPLDHPLTRCRESKYICLYLVISHCLSSVVGLLSHLALSHTAAVVV